MKPYLYSLKQVFKASPPLVILHLACNILPAAVLSGLMISAERNMLNSVQNYILGSSTLTAFVTCVILYCVYRVINTLFSIADPYLLDRIRVKVQFYVKRDINNKYLKLKYEYFEQSGMLDIFENIGQTSNQIYTAYTRTINVVSSLAKIVSMLVAMALVSWQFTLVAVGAGIIASFFYMYYALMDARLYGRLSKQRRLLAAYQDLFCVSLQHTIPEFRAFNTSEKMVNYANDNIVKVQKYYTSQHKKIVFVNSVAAVIPPLVLVSYVVYLLDLYINKGGVLPLGDISVGITGFISITSSLSYILMQVYRIKYGAIYLSYYFQFKNLEEERMGSVDKLPANPVINVRNLCFTYPGTEKQVLNNVSFDITLGEHIAFVGENGSGKSTIIKLILGLYAPNSGSVEVNGIGIRDYTISARQRLFGVQYQDFYNYSLAVRDVVSIGNPDIRYKDKAIEGVLKQANIKNALKAKNATLDTMVGKEWSDDAIEFSGGEKQRMSLSSTLAFNHRHLILDEPTAALDAVAENKMYEVFMSGIKNKGSLIVSHRLASARIADRIIVFCEGRVVQDGSHEKLMKDKRGLYYKMFTAQSSLYKDKVNEKQS